MLDDGLIRPGFMRPPEAPSPQPIDLGFFISAHQYLRSIPEPSEAIRRAIAHLENQISSAILSISIRVGPAPKPLEPSRWDP
jgi:hypothetical protein